MRELCRAEPGTCARDQETTPGRPLVALTLRLGRKVKRPMVMLRISVTPMRRKRRRNMKRSLSILAMIGLVGSSFALAGAATAQQPANPAPARPATPMPQYTAADAEAVLNARIVALKAVIWPDAGSGEAVAARRGCDSRHRQELLRASQAAPGGAARHRLRKKPRQDCQRRGSARQGPQDVHCRRPAAARDAQPGAEAPNAGFSGSDGQSGPVERPALVVRGGRRLRRECTTADRAPAEQIAVAMLARRQEREPSPFH
jgi:hypothetical protein